MTVSVHGQRPAWQALRPSPSARTPWTALLVMLVLLVPSAVSAHGTGIGGGHTTAAPESTPYPDGAAPADRVGPAPVAQRGPAMQGSGHSGGGDHGVRSGADPWDDGPAMLCPVLGGGRSDSGCSSHRHCAQDAMLPNAPPQPPAATLPRALVLRPVPGVQPRGPLAGSDRAPDLHLLQVQRT
ncbi:hypothetical protein [Peterkaempfera bronchialis]|uniref:hypothetical protein n=1 Tax=Peterkaempfera bronchialis TaxID=2126346 RepID=UPI003C2BC329